VGRIAAAAGDQRRETNCLGKKSAEGAEIPRWMRRKGRCREVSLSASGGNPSGGFARCGSFSSPNVTLFITMRASLPPESANVVMINQEITTTCDNTTICRPGLAEAVRITIRVRS
jgi:hypothetical protein